MKQGSRNNVGEDQQQFGEQRRDDQGICDPIGRAQCDAMTACGIGPRLRVACRWVHLQK